MELRRAAPLVFTALCLGLSGMVLHRQFAAHPMPPAGAAPASPKKWDIASQTARRAVLETIGGQLAALRAGDADKAMSYQTEGLRRKFHSPAEFERMLAAQDPEFRHSRSAQYSGVRTADAGQYAEVIVMVLGENGRRARGYYQLVREKGGYKIAGVEGGGAIN